MTKKDIVLIGGNLIPFISDITLPIHGSFQSGNGKSRGQNLFNSLLPESIVGNTRINFNVKSYIYYSNQKQFMYQPIKAVDISHNI